MAKNTSKKGKRTLKKNSKKSNSRKSSKKSSSRKSSKKSNSRKSKKSVHKALSPTPVSPSPLSFSNMKTMNENADIHSSEIASMRNIINNDDDDLNLNPEQDNLFGGMTYNNQSPIPTFHDQLDTLQLHGGLDTASYEQNHGDMVSLSDNFQPSFSPAAPQIGPALSPMTINPGHAMPDYLNSPQQMMGHPSMMNPVSMMSQPQPQMMNPASMMSQPQPQMMSQPQPQMTSPFINPTGF